jgi:hypothetical protein
VSVFKGGFCKYKEKLLLLMEKRNKRKLLTGKNKVVMYKG